MATYADGGLTATKPYVSGAAYINRMSNFCGHCQYNPKKALGDDSCPFTALYWTFLERNEPPRLQLPHADALQHPPARNPSPSSSSSAPAPKQAIDHLQSFRKPDY